MCCSEGIDTSTISPLGSSASAHASIGVAAHLTLSPTQTAPNTPPTMAPDIIPTTTAFPAVPANAPTPATLAIPDVSSMESQLKSTGALLGNINVNDHQESSPLTHLQPKHLIQTPEGPKAAFAMPTTPTPAQAIQLASTAPVLQTPTTAQLINHQNQLVEPTSTTHHMISGILIVLTITSISVLGIFLYNQIVINEAEIDGSALGGMYSLLEKLPFVAKDDTTNAPKAVWYK